MGRNLHCNWEAFWGAVLKDHCHAGLIWNERTRSELREALQVQMQLQIALRQFLLGHCHPGYECMRIHDVDVCCLAQGLKPSW